MQTQVLDFDGQTYKADEDRVRLTNALESVYNIMKDGKWRTLRYLAKLVGCSEAGVSARIRDFRKDKFQERFPNVKTTESMRLDGGLWAYRMVLKTTSVQKDLF